MALVAIGGYGRAELSPRSDIDLVLLLADASQTTPATLRGILYPLWDAGWQVGHCVTTARDAIARADSDLAAATSLLSARLVAGHRALFEELIDRRKRWVAHDRRALARRILDATKQRHQRRERAGWSLAPDLKEDVGGLRDLHVVTWLGALAGEAPYGDSLTGANERLLAVREVLHTELNRKSDVVRIDLQPRLAARLGLDHDGGADILMTEVHTAARFIEHASAQRREELAGRILGGPSRAGSSIDLGHGARILDGALTLDPGAGDVAAALRLLAWKASTGKRIAPQSVRALLDIFSSEELAPWTDAEREPFFALLAVPHCASALELLDHAGGWQVLMPEWLRVRGKPQHDPYHRYTVDGHSFMTVEHVSMAVDHDAVAASAARDAGDLDALRLAALLHDVGKGSAEDHSVAGERISRKICARMGLDRDTTDDVCTLVRSHLLLADTATRRDLDDGAVIAHVAEGVGTARRLRLLYVLSVADGKATGPAGWSEWKAALVRELYRKTLIALETGELPERSDVTLKAREVEAFDPALAGRAAGILEALPPSYLDATTVPDMVDDIKLLLRAPGAGQICCRVDPGTERGQVAITVCVADVPGTLARTSGVLALHGAAVLTARAYSTSTGLALERFIVGAPEGFSPESFEADLASAYSGRLALEAELARKAYDYRPSVPVAPEVRILDDASADMTVIEVRAPDAVGLLYALTAGLADLGLDIKLAKIDTLGTRVVDVFYVTAAWGTKLDDAQSLQVRRALEHRVRTLWSSPT